MYDISRALMKIRMKTDKLPDSNQNSLNALHTESSKNGSSLSDSFDSLMECFHCARKFKRRASLRKHIFQAHHPEGTPRTFECDRCSRIFLNNYSLKRHFRQMHQSVRIPPSLDCPICSKSFSCTGVVKRHIREVHAKDHTYRNIELSTFECARCKMTFSQNKLRLEHIVRCHPGEMKRGVSKVTRLKCLKCGDLFVNQKELNYHYKTQHNITLVFDQLHFATFKHFEEWFENMKRQTITDYNVYSRYTTLTNTKKLGLICHRSRGYHNIPKNSERKISLKANGYKGLDGHCPAEIKVTQSEDGTCDVLYQKTHVGHAVGDRDELKHIYLTESQKRQIADVIRTGASIRQIQAEKLLSNARNGVADRLELLSANDFYRVVAKYKIDLPNTQRTESTVDSANAKKFIEQHGSKILYYKCLGEDDRSYRKLGKDDFALVIMDETYAQYLREYGKKVIAFGCTRLKNLHDCMLHTLLVLDNEEEGLPVAFLVSNRSDRSVIEIFIKRIRARVGVIKAKTLITDMQTSYYESWSELMAPPQFFLFCFSRVCEAWRQNYFKIASKEKRAPLVSKLLDLAKEPNILSFEVKLASFLTIYDASTKPFIEYFKQYFAHNTHCWAYCFRQDAGINTNIAVYSFHRNLKKSLTQSCETIHQCLVHIFECLVSKQAEILRKQIKVTSKLSILQKRHHIAYLYFKSGDEPVEVTPVGSSAYLVSSFQNDESDSYTVRKNEKTCSSGNSVCNLLCNSCNICFHEYSCSCQDHSIKNNMCKHIHWLGLWLQNKRVVPEYEGIENIEIDDTPTKSVAESIEIDDTSTKSVVESIEIDDTLTKSVVESIEIDDTSTKSVAESSSDDEDSVSYWREKASQQVQQLLTDLSTMSAEQLRIVCHVLDDIPADIEVARDREYCHSPLHFSCA